MIEDIDLHGEESKPAAIVYEFKAGEIDLAQELATQYGKAKSLYANVEHDFAIPPNQKAQVLNTLTAIITSITKSQAEVYNMNRLKALEDALITTLRTLDEATQATFFAAYEANLAKSAA